MPKFRKRPVVIEAVQMPTDMNDEASLNLLEAHLSNMGAPHDLWEWDDRGITIETLEGDHLASPGDWIIKGVAGEFYPCKPEIFAATYEPADD